MMKCKPWNSVLLLVMAVLQVSGGSGDFDLPMRALLLVPTDDPKTYPALSSARAAFAGQGIDYDEFLTRKVYESNFSLSLPLQNVDGSPRYQAIVLVQRDLVFQALPNYWLSTLSNLVWAKEVVRESNWSASSSTS